MSKEAAQNPSADIAVWFDGKAINEVIFCEEFQGLSHDYGKRNLFHGKRHCER